MTVEEYLGDWLKVINRKELDRVLSILDKEYEKKSICPPKSNVFRAFNLCPYNDLRIIFIGQDPFPQKGVATGILFGNSKTTTEEQLSPSLKVIKESVIDFETHHDSIIFDNSLESWCKQGILMINSALTVIENRIGSHVMLWRPFISNLLINLSKYNSGIIYVLFGSQAQTFKPYINSKSNYIFECKHPAYYARLGKRADYTIFKEINSILQNNNNLKIKWYGY